MNRKHKGAWAELRATAWLLAEGWEVFRNVSQHGHVDLIVRHPTTGELREVEVRTGYWPPEGKLAYGKSKHGIRCLVVIRGEVDEDCEFVWEPLEP